MAATTTSQAKHAWAARAKQALPVLSGVRAAVLVFTLTVGGVGAAGLCLIACYGLIERRAWGAWLAGLLAVASLVGYARHLAAAGPGPGFVQHGLDVLLCVGVLVMLVVAGEGSRAAARH